MDKYSGNQVSLVLTTTKTEGKEKEMEREKFTGQSIFGDRISCAIHFLFVHHLFFICGRCASHICHLHEISYSIRFAHLGLFHVDCFLHIFRLFHLSLEREFLRVLKAAYSLGFRGVSDVKT